MPEANITTYEEAKGGLKEDELRAGHVAISEDGSGSHKGSRLDSEHPHSDSQPPVTSV